LLAAVAAAAVWRQDFAAAQPFVLFNDGRAMYLLLARVSLALTIALAGIFAYELVRNRATAIGGAARTLVVMFLVLELMVAVLDAAYVSRPTAKLGGPYREVASTNGVTAILRRPHGRSTLGFRGDEGFPKKSDGPRVLFLGDSYTEGSGSDTTCNYPNVAVHTLNAERASRGARTFGLMNAGVAGYGPVEALALYRYLVDEGYQFDAVVMSLFLENDFTDDLPATDRRVVAGIVLRYPSSVWLRIFHPLNTHTARYGMMLLRARSMRTTVSPNWGQGCRSTPAPVDTTALEGMRASILNRLETNYGPSATIAPGVVSDALTALANETKARGIPLTIVVFPDRILADTSLRRQLAIPDLESRYDLGRLRKAVRSSAGQTPVIDLTESLTGPAANYLVGDTHLSDIGNVLAGQTVGRQLGGLLAGVPPETPGRR
jgi:hypothetical protein